MISTQTYLDIHTNILQYPYKHIIICIQLWYQEKNRKDSNATEIYHLLHKSLPPCQLFGDGSSMRVPSFGPSGEQISSLLITLEVTLPSASHIVSLDQEATLPTIFWNIICCFWCCSNVSARPRAFQNNVYFLFDLK